MLIDFDSSIVRLDRSRATRPHRRELAPGRLKASARATVRRWVTPTNLVAASNIERLLSLLPGEDPLVLVIGGGTEGNGVGALYTQDRARVLAFDIYASELTQFIADAHRVPLTDGCVDAVVIQAVLEHVLDPSRVVAEIHRVIKRQGLVYAETPFLQQVHAGPYDFTRYTSGGHRYLFRHFEEIGAGVVAGPATALVWSIEHMVRGLLRSPTAGRIVRLALQWIRRLDRFIPEPYAMDSASAHYFLGRPSDHAMSAAEIIAYYRGAQGSPMVD